MADQMDNTFTMTHPAEIAFPPALYEPRLATPQSKEPRWEIALLMAQDHPDLKAIKDFCKRVAETQSPGITNSPTAWKYPWSSADAYVAKQAAKETKYDNSHLVGKVLLNSHAAPKKRDGTLMSPPKLSVLMPGRGVVDFWDEAARQTVKDKFYAGCEALCEFSFVWYPASNGLPGVTAYIRKVCSLNRGERRSGAKSGSETFGAHVGHLSAVDPTAGVGAQIDY